ncbi:MAG: FHA domain-containing protein [Desulfovibrio sp.]|nr:FHA domain-containing protein [Desulfovibrio sp.]MBI4958457.1 FHA domain-containing protein [Desulfovibrio sp.]
MLILTISKGPETVCSLDLGPGKHLVGRKEGCAVVLADPDVSSVHAQIEVGEREVVVKDMESLNGVFSRGNKIGKVSFSQDVDFEIAGYSFKGRFKAEKKRLGLPAVSKPSLTVLVSAMLLLATLCTLCVFWIAGASSVHNFTQRESLRRGTLLARSLAEQNVSPLRAKLADQVRVTPVSAEEGVRYAFVADQYGKVLAPAQAIGKVLSHSKIAEALREGHTTMYDSPEGDTILVSPIKDAEGVLGVAVLSYAPGTGLVGPSLVWSALLGIVAAVSLALAGAWIVLRAFFGQIRSLAEQIGLALKSGKHGLNLTDMDPGLADLGQAVERLLLLPRAQGEPERDHFAATTAPPPAPSAQDRNEPAPADADLEAQPGPCFLMDLADYRILAWNQAFGPLAASGVKAPVHLLRGLNDPDHLTAVLGLLENPEDRGESPLAGTYSSVSKIPAGQGQAVFLFKDTHHG